MPGTQKSKQARGNRSGKAQGRRDRRRTTSRRPNAPTQASSLRGSPSQEMRFGLPLFPANYRRRLHYYETGLSVTSSAGLAGTYFFQANGLYDPNVTGTGHQPMGFDQVMLFFTTYTVVASEIQVTARNTAAAACCSSMSLKEAASASTDPTITMESGLVSLKTHYPGSGGQYGSIRTHVLKCDVANYFARQRPRRNLINDASLCGTATTNPTEGVYFMLSAWDPNLVAVSGVFFDVYIVFDVMFSEPRRGTLSQISDLLRSGTAKNLGPGPLKAVGTVNSLGPISEGKRADCSTRTTLGLQFGCGPRGENLGPPSSEVKEKAPFRPEEMRILESLMARDPDVRQYATRRLNELTVQAETGDFLRDCEFPCLTTVAHDCPGLDCGHQVCHSEFHAGPCDPCGPDQDPRPRPAPKSAGCSSTIL